MRFSDLGRMQAARMGATLSASTIPDASAAITSGQNTFNAAYSAAGGSLQGTAAAAAGIVASLPKGQIQTALNDAMNAIGYAEAGAAIGSVIPGYGTAIGAVIGAAIGIFSSITSGSQVSTEGEFRSTAEQFCFPALALTPTVGETPSQLAQTVLQPCVFPTYRQNAVSWMPIQVDDNFGAPYVNESKPVNFTFGVGWLPPPSSTAASTSQGYFLACAWMASNGVSRALSLKHDDSQQDLHAFGKAVQEQAITALGSEKAFTDAMNLFRSWYGTGGWSTKIPTELKGMLSGPEDPQRGVSKAWTGGTTGHPSYSQLWKSLIDILRQPAQQFDFTYYPANYALLNDEGGTFTGASAEWDLVGMSEPIWERIQGSNASGKDNTGTNVALMPDTTAIGLAELACLCITGIVPREGADVAALHYLLGMQWLWRQGYQQDALRSKQAQALYGIGFTYNKTNPNISRCIGLVTAKIRAAKKKAAKAKPAKPAAHAKQTASSYTAIQTTAHAAVVQQEATVQRAAIAQAVQAQAAAAAVTATSDSDRNLAIAGVILAAGAAVAVHLRKKRRRG